MREKRIWPVLSFLYSGSDGEAELLGVPVNDDCGQKVQSSHAVVLAFSGGHACCTKTRPARPLRS